jgi:hypothetical protein
MVVVITERIELERFGDPTDIIMDYFAAAIQDQ